MELQYQKDKLKRNLEHLRERSRENDLLSSVIVDYERYEERLRMKDRKLTEQKTAHEQHLQMLDAYIRDIMETNELTESGLNKITYENNRILSELDRLRTSSLEAKTTENTEKGEKDEKTENTEKGEKDEKTETPEKDEAEETEKGEKTETPETDDEAKKTENTEKDEPDEAKKTEKGEPDEAKNTEKDEAEETENTENTEKEEAEQPEKAEADKEEEAEPESQRL